VTDALSWLWPSSAREPDLVVFLGAAAALPLEEQAAIARIARDARVDPAALAAIRIAENGGPGREFGVLSVTTLAEPDSLAARAGLSWTYEPQARIAAHSIQSNIGRYVRDVGAAAQDVSGRLTEAFWSFMGARWAPLGAANDPTGLNRHWVSNVTRAYDTTTVIG
jgi:hypothetical protein